MDRRRGPEVSPQAQLPLGAPKREAATATAAAKPGDKTRPLTIEALVRVMSLLLEQHIGIVWVEGEVSGLRVHASGHVYFTLKDGGGQVPAVMWRSTAQRLRFRLEEGKHFLVRARPAVYAEQGKLQLYVEAIEPAGLGAAALALEQLKQRLAAEGLFEAAKKRPLPALPRRIGVVTSASGAAVKDITRAIERRFPTPVLISPCRVQGEGAAADVAAAVRRLWRHDVDVIIVGRGGGSQEDLSAFNEESVVRAIAASPVPVVSAVGHEVDVTLADLAADVRAATPTAAGELCVPERRLLREALGEVEARLARAGGVALERRRRALEKLEARLSPHDPRRMLARDRQRIDELVGRAQTVMRARLAAARRELDRLDGRRAGAHPATRLGEHRARLAELGVRLERAGRRALDLRRRALGEAAARLGAMSPLAVLERGYALARTPDGTVVTDAAQVAPGDELELRLARGALDVRVERVREREREKEKK